MILELKIEIPDPEILINQLVERFDPYDYSEDDLDYQIRDILEDYTITYYVDNIAPQISKDYRKKYNKLIRQKINTLIKQKYHDNKN